MASRSLSRSGLVSAPKYASLLVGNTAFSPGAYELISTTVLSATTTTITFSSIDQTYKHLQIRGVVRTGGGEVNIRLNGNASSTYQDHYLTANGATVGAGNANVYTYIRGWESGTQPSIFGPGIIDILDYSNANKRAVIRYLGGRTNDGGNYNVRLGSGFVPLGAVTSVTLFNSNNFESGTRFSLYGIKG